MIRIADEPFNILNVFLVDMCFIVTFLLRMHDISDDVD